MSNAAIQFSNQRPSRLNKYYGDAACILHYNECGVERDWQRPGGWSHVEQSTTKALVTSLTLPIVSFDVILNVAYNQGFLEPCSSIQHKCNGNIFRQ